MGVIRKRQSHRGPQKVTESEGFLEEVTLKGAGERGGEGRQGAGNHLEELVELCREHSRSVR